MADTRTDTGEGLPDLPEPGINTASHIHTRIVGYTAEQVRQAQREAVEAASMSFDDITGDEPDWWHRLQAAAEAMDDAGLTANAVDARFIAGHLLAALRAQQPAPPQQPSEGFKKLDLTDYSHAVNYSNGTSTHVLPPTRGTDSCRQIKSLVGCAAGRDGDCNHPLCPQARDGEPHKSQRHCPLDTLEDDE